MLTARRVTDVGPLQQARTHDHGSAQFSRPGGLEAYHCASQRIFDGDVPEGHCCSKLGQVRGLPLCWMIHVSPVARLCRKLWLFLQPAYGKNMLETRDTYATE